MACLNGTEAALHRFGFGRSSTTVASSVATSSIAIVAASSWGHTRLWAQHSDPFLFADIVLRVRRIAFSFGLMKLGRSCCKPTARLFGQNSDESSFCLKKFSIKIIGSLSNSNELKQKRQHRSQYKPLDKTKNRIQNIGRKYFVHGR